MVYSRYCLLTEPRFNHFWRLGCEWIVDMFSHVEDQILQAIKLGKQSKFSHFFHDSDEMEEEANYQLPASFTGSAQYYADKVADSLALAHHIGKPDLMITATFNPNWPEITS